MTKVRLGFVTNSSSSSFILQKKNLTESQIEKVMHHGEYARARNISQAGYFSEAWDDWRLADTGDTIEGFTTMDNFDMEGFLKYIGISEKDFKVDKDG